MCFLLQANNVYIWRELTSLDLSENSIAHINLSAVSLVPKLRSLNLSHNALDCLANLSNLCDLEELNLSNNRMQQLPDVHTKLGNVKTIHLAQNKLRRLDGLSKVYGLVHLDVRSNRISDLETIRCVTSLPCLEGLILTGNAVTTVLDFRIKVLTMFGKSSSSHKLKMLKKKVLCYLTVLYNVN